MQTSIELVSKIKPSSSLDEYNRGIFQIIIPSFSIPNSEVDGGCIVARQKMRFIIYVSVDASGSMEEIATKRGQSAQTKMDFVHLTLTNMIEYIASQETENPHAEFYLAIVSFDSSAKCVLLTCRVTSENKDNIIQMITNIKPCGGTNFQKCFHEIARLMSSENQYIENDSSIPDNFVHRMHIFMTDGANNEGEKNIQRLAAFLTPTFPETENAASAIPSTTQKTTKQIMIGYGPDHDSTMLQNLCLQFPKSKQWFIDDVEKTGCIFGEILWSALNTAFSDVILSSNVEIYDFADMSWKNEIAIDDLIHDSSRTFYVRVPYSIETVSCKLTYFSTESPANTSHTNQTLIIYSNQSEIIDETSAQASLPIMNEKVEHELWRLDTIMTIDQALKFLQNIRLMSHTTSIVEKNRLIDVVTAFQEKFLMYVIDKTLCQDPFMIQLADDLFVCISGLMAANIGERYVAARQASQIQQRAVTVNDITPLQTEILSSMPLSSSYHTSHHGYTEDCYDNYPPAAPRRANSGGGFVSDDTYSNVNTYAMSDTRSDPTTPSTPMGKGDNSPTMKTPNAGDEAEEKESKENEKLVSDFTPSSRGIGSKLRYLSRETIIGMRRVRDDEYDSGDGAENYSCGGVADDTFSSHASPACARIGRMLSAPTPRDTTPNRTSTCPY
jgi:hypothetical protein